MPICIPSKDKVLFPLSYFHHLSGTPLLTGYFNSYVDNAKKVYTDVNGFQFSSVPRAEDAFEEWIKKNNIKE